MNILAKRAYYKIIIMQRTLEMEGKGEGDHHARKTKRGGSALTKKGNGKPNTSEQPK